VAVLDKNCTNDGELTELVALEELLRHPDFTEWRAQAACHDRETAFFFPPPGSPTEPIRRFCAQCPVRLACLAAAVQSPQPEDGWWGGRPPQEVQELRLALREGHSAPRRSAMVRAVEIVAAGGTIAEAAAACAISTRTVRRYLVEHRPVLQEAG
jgi:hypothetical protein